MGTSTQESTGTSTLVSTVTTTATTTATTARRCNGNPEADECAALSESDCGQFMLPSSGTPSSNSTGTFDVSTSCPALCGTCTTSTTTPTTATCNGIPDPQFCHSELH